VPFKIESSVFKSISDKKYTSSLTKFNLWGTLR